MKRSALLAILSLALGLLVSLACAVPAQAGRGDTNNDGVIDGIDALMVFQHVRGKVLLTAEQAERADVHPIPGKEGRVVGDGQVTADDASQLLRYLVGLITRGELAGDLDGPLITEFDPPNGQVGTRVTLRGIHFVAGSPEKNVVSLGGMECAVSEAGATELKVTVPQGAESGMFRLVTPGGEATSRSAFLITSATNGRLTLPARSRRSPGDFTIVNTFDEAAPGADGRFTIQTGPEFMPLVIALPPGGGDNGYMALHLPGVTQPAEGRGRRATDEIEVGPRSTALSLILINPAVCPKDDYPLQELVTLIHSLPQTQALADTIEAVYPTNTDPLEDPRVQQALRAAIEALLVKLPPPDVLSIADAGRAAAASRAREAIVRDIDTAATQVSLEPKPDHTALRIGNNLTTPVDWLTRVFRLPDEQFANGMADIDNAPSLHVYERGDEIHNSLVSARGLGNIFALLSDVSVGISETVGLPLKASALASPRAKLDSQTDAVYLVRTFSGAFRVSDRAEAAFIPQLPSGEFNDASAMLLNLIGAHLDFTAATVGVLEEGAMRRIALGASIAVSKKAMQLGIVSKQSSASSRAAVEVTFGLLWELISAAFGDIVQVVKEELGALFERPWWKKALFVTKAIAKTFNIVGKVVAFGRVAERLTAMVGLHPLAPVTPLETALVVVGDPFSPRVKSYPPEAGTGEEIVIQGERFAPKAEDNQVFFGSRPGEVLAANAAGTELRVRVPLAHPGKLPLTIQTRRGKVGAGLIDLYRLPVVSKIDPLAGFAAAGTFDGQEHKGTLVALQGSFFSGRRFEVATQDYVVDDVVLFQGASGLVKAEVEDPGSATTSQMRVRVPAGARTGKLVIYADGRAAETQMEFQVAAKPTLTEVFPAEGRAGDTVHLFGKDFLAYTGEARVRVQVGETVVTQPTARDGASVISTFIPSQVPEGAQAQVWVETPAGASEKLTVKRLAGMAEGFKLFVRPSSEVAPNGELTFGEALLMAQSKLNIFSGGFDDVDVEILHKQYKLYNDKDQYYGTEDHYTVESRKAAGQPGCEFAYITHKYYDRRPTGTTLTRTENSKVNLDYGAHQIGTLTAEDIPGMGRGEEGDSVLDMRWGKDFADVIEVPADEDDPIVGDVELGEGAGGDTLRFRGSRRVIQGNLTIASSGNRLYAQDGRPAETFTVTGKVTITGKQNLVQGMIAHGGIVVQGNGNTLWYCQAGSPGKRLATGVQIGDGVRGNKVEMSLVQNCAVGVLVTGGAQANEVNPVVANCDVGIRVSGSGTRDNKIGGQTGYTVATPYKEVKDPCGIGIEISDGASENRVDVRAKYSRSHGAVLKGKETRGNRLFGTFQANEGHGIHVAEGANGNFILGESGVIDSWAGRAVQNGGHGVLIEGTGSDSNPVACAAIEGNGGFGVAVIGAAGAPANTVIDNCIFYANAAGQVLARDLPGSDVPPLVARDNVMLGPNEADQPIGPAIVLDNTRGARLARNLINLQDNLLVPPLNRGSTVGILIRGAGSTGTVSQLDAIGACAVAAVQVTDGAADTLFENLEVVGAEKVGVLIEGGASNTTLVRRLGLSVRRNVLDSEGCRISHKAGAVGILVRDGAKRALVDGYWVWPQADGASDSVVVEGVGTTDTTLISSRFRNVVVRDGATVTHIGSPVAARGCTFTPPELRKGDWKGIWVHGAATKDVTILNSLIRYCGQGAVVVEGAQGVRIGAAGAGNQIGDVPDACPNIRISGARDVTVAGNVLEPPGGAAPAGGWPLNPEEIGISVEGGSSAVVVGGRNPGEGNTVTHHATGIAVRGTGTRDVQVIGNVLLGSARQATGVLVADGAQQVGLAGNTVEKGLGDGVRIQGAATAQVLVERNTIAGNGGHGVVVADGAHGNTVRGNRIASNGAYGVGLGAGTAANRVLEGSITGNLGGGIQADRPEAPRVTELLHDTVSGEVGSGVASGSTVQVYADRGAQGLQYLGRTQVHGKAWRLKTAPPLDLNVTATVTDPAGNTSAFGPVSAPRVRPAFSGDQALAFTSTRAGNREIFLRLPGEPDRRLTDDPAADHSPALSLAAAKIAFVSERAGNPEIYIMNLDGTNQGRRTNHAAPDYDPAWSPDGKKLLFVSERDGNPEVYVMGIGGDNVVRLTNSAGADRHPAWSPDGTKIAFTSDRGGNPDVWVMNADGTNPVRLTDHASPDYDPAWSPDGARLAFVSERDGNPDVYLVDANGANATRLTVAPGADVEPVWSPDGAWVAFCSAQAGDAELFARQVASGRQERLTVSLGLNVQPSWSGAAVTRLAASGR